MNDVELSNEHRVRNHMAVRRAIAGRSNMRRIGRMQALWRAQALSTRPADCSISVGSLLHDEVSAMAREPTQFLHGGPNVALSIKAAEVLTLALHELGTNTARYGALSVPWGKLTVHWESIERQGVPWLVFDWTELGVPEPRTPADGPRRRGFGCELIEARIAYELGGQGKIVILPGSAHCHLEFPLQATPAESGAGAPRPGGSFGIEPDLAASADLRGRHVLVVEDEYYIATDTARALRGAGADVLGPSPNEQAARSQLATRLPDAAILDINLGVGASFQLAEYLQQLAIPFVFITGYGTEAIPERFRDVPLLQKPLQMSQIVQSVAELLMGSGPIS